MSVLIKDIQRNSSEIIRIEVSEFKGKELINIRIWYQAVDGKSGDVVYKPTQKGVALNIAEFEQLKDGIEKLGQYIRDRHSGSVPDQPISEHVMNDDEVVEETDDDDPAEK
ncbi:MAG TPA: transcriptional coactivator p15/PC4 family protein [Spirochaetota bacterium]|nr:transcriptional coactivator p15/PC4 family protein [Spirochaetota bacterium]HPI88367.1 transcriptional coactivator p15/PC4 family protein [Spirochaetota bacterium]HPR46775.1 transcriptional coactivator p15/PC4 family protein [Spirochaetota bacterium]